MIAQKRMTADELIKLPRGRMRYELIEGELIEMTPAGHLHGRIAMNLAIELGLAVKQQKLGAVYAAETGFYIKRDPDTVRAPDVAFVRAERLKEADQQGYFPGAPDIAVEVISPSDVYQEVEAKVAQWLGAGSQIVIIINPRHRTLKVHRSLTDVAVLNEDDTLTLPELFGDWELSLAEVFD